MKQAIKTFAAIAAVLLGCFLVYDCVSENGRSPYGNHDIGESVCGVLLVAGGVTAFVSRRRLTSESLEAGMKMNSAALGIATKEILGEIDRLRSEIKAASATAKYALEKWESESFFSLEVLKHLERIERKADTLGERVSQIERS